MKNKKLLKTLMWKYNVIKYFIAAIVFLILVCFIGASYLYRREDNFGYSTLLNISGGLFTGLILLFYQYVSNKNIKDANLIIEKLKLIDDIPVFTADVLDFCTDYTMPTQEQMEYYGIEIDTILEDNEGLSYALNKYLKELKKAEKQFSLIKEFSNNVLKLPIDFLSYENALSHAKQFFSKYTEEIEYAMPPYILPKYTNVEDFESDIIGILNTEEELNNYLKNNLEILNSPYEIDPSSDPYEVRVIYCNNERVLIGDVYKDWIQEMNHLSEKTKEFNKEFMAIKEIILSVHEQNSNIIH